MIMINVDRSQLVTLDYGHCGLRNRFAINYNFRGGAMLCRALL